MPVAEGNRNCHIAAELSQNRPPQIMVCSCKFSPSIVTLKLPPLADSRINLGSDGAELLRLSIICRRTQLLLDFRIDPRGDYICLEF
jgi:hypothetical protein